MGREARVPRDVIKRIRTRRKDNTWTAAEFAGRVFNRLLPKPEAKTAPAGPSNDTLEITVGGDDE